ncbi:hypothetical protein AB0D74_26445 [Streptomyces sp. NPDC048278]|uniref:hypothetical protein n=1 Tax=Streptomyces sp. NPDC048278 TaxID=3155809 RepID=UPI003439E4DD
MLPTCAADGRPQLVSRPVEPPGPKVWVPFTSMANRLTESPLTPAWKTREEVSALVTAYPWPAGKVWTRLMPGLAEAFTCPS